MRLFLTFIRGPLWLKILMMLVFVGIGLVAADGRAIEFAKSKFGGVTEAATQQAFEQVVAEAAAKVGGDGFAALGLGDTLGVGGTANPGAKRVAVQREPIDWRNIDYKAKAIETFEYLKANPLVAFMILIGLMAFKMITSSIVDRIKLSRERKAKAKSNFKRDGGVDSVLDDRVLNKSLDAAFENPNAATGGPDALRVAQPTQQVHSGKPADKTHATSYGTKKASRGRLGLLGRSKKKDVAAVPDTRRAKPTQDQRLQAIFAEKMLNDPFERLEAVRGRQ